MQITQRKRISKVKYLLQTSLCANKWHLMNKERLVKDDLMSDSCRVVSGKWQGCSNEFDYYDRMR